MPHYELTKVSKLNTLATSKNQCKDVGHSEYTVSTTIICGARLDCDGFTIDNSIIHKCAVDVIEEQMGSCEQLAQRIANRVILTCQLHGTELREIRVKIEPTNGTTTVIYATTIEH